jgi:PAS domain S-box-containing protein
VELKKETFVKEKRHPFAQDAYSIIQSLADGFLRADTDGYITIANNAIAVMCGYSSPREMVGMHMKNLYVHPEERAAMLNELRHGGMVINFTLELYRKDGSTFWSLNNIKALFDDQGTLIATEGVIRDITDIKKTEEALKRSNRILSSIRKVNRLITQETDQDTLLNEICTILTENRGYHNAWIALIDKDRKLDAFYSSGFAGEETQLITFMESHGITRCARQALESETVVTITTPASTCSDCPIAHLYQNRGSLSAPIIHRSKRFGIITASVPHEHLDATDAQLFQGIADDIGLALHSIEQLHRQQAINQQLAASEQQLQAMNQQLEASNQQLQASESSLRNNLFELNERLKEMQCISSLAEIVNRSTTIEEILSQTVELIPPAWQHPEHTVARISFDQREYTTPEFQCSITSQQAHIQINGATRGTIEVCYLIPDGETSIEPFLPEEATLIQSIARFVSNAIEKILFVDEIVARDAQLQSANQQLQASEQQLQAMNQQLTASNQQLTSSEQQLRAANQQLTANEAALKQALATSQKQRKANLILLHDITVASEALKAEVNQRKQTELQLRIMQERLQLALRTTHATVFEDDFITGEMICTPEMFIHYGYGIDEIPTSIEAFAQLIHPDDMSIVMRALDTHIKDKTPQYFAEYRIKDKAGEWKWIDGRGRITQWTEQGEPHIMIGISRDIHASKLITEQLRISESRYRRAQEIGHVGNWEYNIQTTQFWGSDEAKRIYGYNPDHHTFSTEEIERCIPERERVHQALIDLIEHDTPYDLTFEIYAHDTGESKFIRSIASLERDIYGAPLQVTGVIVDITQLMQTHTALQDSTALLREAQKIGQMGSWKITLEDLHITWSDEVYDIFGVAAGEFDETYDAFMEYVHPQDREYVHNTFFEAVERKQTHAEVEHRILHTDGTVRYVYQKCLNLFNEQGDIYASIGIVQDITERKAREEKLNKLLHEQNVLLKNDPSFIIYKDTHNNIIRVTDTVAKLTGMAREEIEGKPSAQIYPSMAEKYYQDDLEVIESGIPKLNIIEELPAVDGSKKWLLTNKVPMKDAQGTITGIIVFSTDITDLKSTQDELEQREAMLRDAQRIGRIGNWMMDITTRTVYMSEEMYELIGLEHTAASLEVSTHQPYYTPESWDRFQNAIAHARDTGQKYEIEVEFSELNPRYRYAIARGEPIYTESTLTGMKGTLQDITESKLSHLQIESSLREKETLLSEIYHRTKNNMQLISSLLSIQARQYKEPVSRKLIEQLRMKIDAMALAQKNLYKSEDLSQINLKPYIIELSQLVQSRYLHDALQVEHIYHLDGIYVNLDTVTSLSLIITELLTNAYLHAWPQEGKGTLTITLTREKEAISITIQDNGVGLPADFDMEIHKGLGLRTVFMLAINQLNGTLDHEVNEGLLWKITYRDDLYTRRV